MSAFERTLKSISYRIVSYRLCNFLQVAAEYSVIQILSGAEDAAYGVIELLLLSLALLLLSVLLAYVQIPLVGPEQTLSETRVSDKSADFVWSGPVCVREVEFSTGPTRICRWSGLVVSVLNSTTRTGPDQTCPRLRPGLRQSLVCV